MSFTERMRAAIERLATEDAVGQLRRREGVMAALGSEDGVLKLDWVEAVSRLIGQEHLLRDVEAEAHEIRAHGIRHVIWAGMGGSVLTVRVMRALGLCDGSGDSVTIHPLDSTDPAALNAIVREIATAKSLNLSAFYKRALGFEKPEHGEKDLKAPERASPLSPSPAGEGVGGEGSPFLRELLSDVMMIGVAMGMTSEEPITHLDWFADLLDQAALPAEDHLLVMALPSSYLDVFAKEHGVPRRDIQPDGGTGTGGRMSAPSTRVFLLPAALALPDSPDGGLLYPVLQRARRLTGLAHAFQADHPSVLLAAAMSAATHEGACRLLVSMPPGWEAFTGWLEQLMEESLGKGGQGVVVFDDQPLAPANGLFRVRVVPQGGPPVPMDGGVFTMRLASLANEDPAKRLTALAALCMRWQLTMALYGYLHSIQFAGQPAVENYKARARILRAEPDPLATVTGWAPAFQRASTTLLAPAAFADESASASLGAVFVRALRAFPLGYLDITVNGAAPDAVLSLLRERVYRIGNTLLDTPVKIRVAPAAYHSTEQSEMDGPADLVSLRIVARESEPMLLGSYDDRFLHAQAVSSWQAMLEAGRPCFLLVLNGTLAEASDLLATFFADVEAAPRHTN